MTQRLMQISKEWLPKISEDVLNRRLIKITEDHPKISKPEDNWQTRIRRQQHGKGLSKNNPTNVKVHKCTL